MPTGYRSPPQAVMHSPPIAHGDGMGTSHLALRVHPPAKPRREDMGLNRKAFGLALVSALVAGTGSAWIGGQQPPPLHGIQHVLLLSVDGLHAVDLANCLQAGTCPNLERLT